jgi:NTE family protein
MLSNSPLDFVIDRCGAEGKKVFVVDLFSQSRPLPSNMVEVMARRDEIVYAERMRGNQRRREQAIAYRRLVESILAQTDPVTQAKIRQRPLYIELMGDGADMHITRFVRQGQDGEPSSRDYDFSVAAIRSNLAAGYALARQTLHAESDNFSSV